MTMPYTTTQVTIRTVGPVITLDTVCGLVMEFTPDNLLSKLEVKVYDNYVGNWTLWGLCGDCNGVTDDLMLPDGTNTAFNHQR